MISSTQVHQVADLLRRLDDTAAESVLAELDPAWQPPIRDLLARPPRCADAYTDTNARTPGGDPTLALLQILEKVLVAKQEECASETTDALRSLSSDGTAHLSEEPHLADSTDADLICVLRNEYPQTAAICLASLAPERAASLLGQLGDTQSVEVLKRLRALTVPDESIMREVCAEVSTSYRASPVPLPNGFAKAEAILQKIPTDLRRELLTSLTPDHDRCTGENAQTEDVRTGFLEALRQDAGLASLEFGRICSEQWTLLDPLIECVPAETLYRAAQGLDFSARQALTERLPDTIQLRIKLIAAEKKPVVVSEIHAAQVEILKRALDSEGYQLAVWQGKKHISVAA